MTEDFEFKWRKLYGEGIGSVYHSYDWAKAREVSGDKPIFIKIESGSEMKAGMVAFEKTKDFLVIGKKKILFSEGNPLCLEKIYSREILKEFKNKSKGFFYGSIYPTVMNYEKDIYSDAGFMTVTNNTMLIDLSLSEEELFKNLEKKSARWGVKFAEKKELVFELSNKEDLKNFYSIYESTTKAGGFHAEKKEFLEYLRNTEISKLFVVKSQDKIEAGGLILIDKCYSCAVLNLAAASESGLRLQAMPFLYWNIIKYCKNLSLRYFDLGGFDAEAKEGDKTYRINKFKERFGGKVVEQYISSTNFKYPLFRRIYRYYKNFFKKTKNE